MFNELICNSESFVNYAFDDLHNYDVFKNHGELLKDVYELLGYQSNFIQNQNI